MGSELIIRRKHEDLIEYLYQSMTHFPKSERFTLVADIKAYFPSIDHDILLNLVARAIRDKNVMWLWEQIVRKSMHGKGLPIGALTSQELANVYLNPLDHYCKDRLRIKRYVRYMDDCVIVGRSRGEMIGLLDEIREFLQNRLRLTLNPKSRIYPVRQGVDFCGYRIWPTHVLPRKRNVKRARRRLKKLARLVTVGKAPPEALRGCLASFHGYMKHCRGRTTEAAILKELDEIIPENIPENEAAEMAAFLMPWR